MKQLSLATFLTFSAAVSTAEPVTSFFSKPDWTVARSCADLRSEMNQKFASIDREKAYYSAVRMLTDENGGCHGLVQFMITPQTSAYQGYVDQWMAQWKAENFQGQTLDFRPVQAFIVTHTWSYLGSTKPLHEKTSEVSLANYLDYRAHVGEIFDRLKAASLTPWLNYNSELFGALYVEQLKDTILPQTSSIAAHHGLRLVDTDNRETTWSHTKGQSRNCDQLPCR